MPSKYISAQFSFSGNTMFHWNSPVYTVSETRGEGGRFLGLSMCRKRTHKSLCLIQDDNGYTPSSILNPYLLRFLQTPNVHQNKISKKDKMLKPRHSPKSPPRLATKSKIVILSEIWYSGGVGWSAVQFRAVKFSREQCTSVQNSAVQLSAVKFSRDQFS